MGLRGVHVKSLHLLLSFAVNLKLSSKTKFIFLKGRERGNRIVITDLDQSV